MRQPPGGKWVHVTATTSEESAAEDCRSQAIVLRRCQFAETREGLFKEEQKRNVGRATRTGLVIIVLLALAAGFEAWRRSRTGEQSTVAWNGSEAAVPNFEDGSELRAAPDEKHSRPTSGVRHLPRNQLNLTVYLPLGSEDGTYELEMVSHRFRSAGIFVRYQSGNTVFDSDCLVRPGMRRT